MLGGTLHGIKSPLSLITDSRNAPQPPFSLSLCQTEWGDIGAPGEKGEPPALSAHVRDRFQKRMSNGIKRASQSGTVLLPGSSRVQAIPTSLHTPGAAAPLLTIIEAEICDK